MKQTKPAFSVFYQPGEEPTFCYRSGLMVYEESLCHGVLVSRGWNAAGYPLNVLTNCPTRIKPEAFQEPSAFHVELDGQSLDYDLRFVDFSVEEAEDHLVASLVLDSNILPVRLTLKTLLDGTQMMTRTLTVENASDRALSLSRLSPLAGGLEIMERRDLTRQDDVEKLYSFGYFEDTAWGREGAFGWHDVVPGTFSVEGRYNRERYRHPLVFLRNNILGQITFAQLGFSGGYRFSVDFDASPERGGSKIGLEAELISVKPLLVLAPGESYTSPELLVGQVIGDLDDAVNEMHDHIRRSVLNVPEADPTALLVGAGMGAEHDMLVPTTKAFMKQFAEMGAEIFIIDAGWACPPRPGIDWMGCNGINHPDAERYPNGIEEVIDECHRLGMKFALWVEIERLGSLCDAYKEHPDWRARDIFGNPMKGFLDLTNPEAFAWAEEELARIITEYRMDLLRVDYNFSAREYFGLREVVPGKAECLTLRHFDAVYRLYGNLKKRFPHVIFENCAGGGGRTDLGIMKAFNHTWVSDWQRAPLSVTITNGMTMALPPERVDRLFAGMGCHAYGSLDLQMRNTMLTHMSLNVIAPAATEPNPQQMEFVRHSVQLYKDFIRPFLPQARVYHHTPEMRKTMEEGYSVLEVAARERDRAAIAAFNLTGATRTDYTVIPRGVDPSHRYRVMLDNSRTSFEVSGYELLNTGVRIHIPSALSSELILIEAID